VGLVQEALEVLQGPVDGEDLVVVGDIVPVVLKGDWKKGMSQRVLTPSSSK